MKGSRERLSGLCRAVQPLSCRFKKARIKSDARHLLLLWSGDRKALRCNMRCGLIDPRLSIIENANPFLAGSPFALQRLQHSSSPNNNENRQTFARRQGIKDTDGIDVCLGISPRRGRKPLKGSDVPVRGTYRRSSSY